MTGLNRVPRLTVAILARDAADPLRLTLASVREIADEILVIDTGSTDGTCPVAREFGSRVLEFPWNDDFAAARNFGQSQATGDWILWLDAGETLADEDAAQLRTFVNTVADPRCGYVLLIRVPASDPQGVDEQIGRVRLLPNRPAIRFTGRVGESPEESLLAAGMTLAGAPYLIRRSEREHELRVKKRRAQRNLRIAECQLREQGESARLWNCLGDALQVLGEGSRALDCYQQALPLATHGGPDMLEAYYGLWTCSPGTHAGWEPRIAYGIQALEVFPLDAQLLCGLGGCLHGQGKLDLAMQCYSQAFKFGQVQPLVWHVTEIRDIAAICYSALLHLQQRGPEAIRFLETALGERPHSVRMRRRLIEDYIDGGQRDAALAHATHLDKSTSHPEALRTAIRGACYASAQNWPAARTYLMTAYEHGSRDPLCLKWLALAMLGNGELAAARPILEQWQTAEPRNSQPTELLARLAANSSTRASSNRQVRVDAPAAPTAANFGLPISGSLPEVTPIPTSFGNTTPT